MNICFLDEIPWLLVFLGDLGLLQLLLYLDSVEERTVCRRGEEEEEGEGEEEVGRILVNMARVAASK